MFWLRSKHKKSCKWAFEFYEMVEIKGIELKK